MAVVTGGRFGIAQAIALMFAHRGAKVAILDWVEDPQTLGLIQVAGGEAIFIRCGVSSIVFPSRAW